ncbi:MAG: ABC transporter ATP-binding protein [Actinomycetota bacterium]
MKSASRAVIKNDVVMSLRINGEIQRASFNLTVNLTVRPGEVVAVVGANGSGKTTLLRALAGLEPLRRGHIKLGDHVWDAVPDHAGRRQFVSPQRRRVGLVFSDLRLFPHLSVRENIAFSPRVWGSRRDAFPTAQTWLTRFGLAELADRHPGQLSGGQAQRVALARAFAGGPQVVLLDEPSSALDPTARRQVRSLLINQLHGFAGPALVVTHDPAEVHALADQVVILREGHVQWVGPVSQYDVGFSH